MDAQQALAQLALEIARIANERDQARNMIAKLETQMKESVAAPTR